MKPIESFSNMNPTSPEIHRLFELQRSYRVRHPAPISLDQRLQTLQKLAANIRHHQTDIVQALAQDFGKPEPEVLLTEILPVLQEIKHTSKHLKSWIKGTRVGDTLATLGTKGRIVPQARGVCLIISPWNYPFNLAMGPLVSCLAAGNSAILKPSEHTPATSALIARLVADTFPQEQVSVVQGDATVSQQLLELPFDHIFFTGSPAVGKLVMEAASKHLTSVTLELGGKSPTVVGPGANLEQAADWITFGKFTNAGQTCIAPDYVMVHASVKDRFVSLLRQRIQKAYPQAGQSPDMAQIVNNRHAQRLHQLVTSAVSLGARVLFGTPSSDRHMDPLLIEAITPEMDIDQEEIFGPVLPILVFEQTEEVIAHIHAKPKPLALYIFERNRPWINHVIASTSSGGVGVNLTMLHYSHPELPFGGVNHSGIGSAHGLHGFKAFSHERAILENRFSSVPWLFPPYTPSVRRLIAWVYRWLG